MEWREEGILIGVRRYGESSVIVEIFLKAGEGIWEWFGGDHPEG